VEVGFVLGSCGAEFELDVRIGCIAWRDVRIVRLAN
jgi:hypothetical protein